MCHFFYLQLHVLMLWTSVHLYVNQLCYFLAQNNSEGKEIISFEFFSPFTWQSVEYIMRVVNVPRVQNSWIRIPCVT
jgi:hypothetical protein